VNELKHSEDQFSALVGQVMDQKLQLLEAKLTAAITPPLSPGGVTAVQTPEVEPQTCPLADHGGGERGRRRPAEMVVSLHPSLTLSLLLPLCL
jgi:hypothetical protein